MNRKRWPSSAAALVLCFFLLAGCRSAQVTAEATPSPTVGDILAPSNLTLSVPALEGMADKILEKSNPDGTSQKILLYDATVGITISRVIPVGFSEDAVFAQMVDTGSTNVSDLVIAQDDAVSAALTYPAWRVTYLTGENEDTRQNTDIYIQTDAWDFYFHTDVPIDNAKDYSAVIESWIASFTLTDAE